VPITYLDTRGFETPVPTTQVKADIEETKTQEGGAQIGDVNAIVEEQIKDRKVCESLLQNFMVDKSDIILIVVAQLTFSDQLLIQRITRQFKEKSKKKIFIVHNYYTISENAYIDEAIKKDVIDVFDVKTQSIPQMDTCSTFKGETNKRYFAERNNSNVMHVIMAREGTPAGEYYNETTIKFLIYTIVTTGDRRVFDPVIELQDYLKSHLKNYINYDSEKNSIELKSIEGPAGKKHEALQLKMTCPLKYKPIQYDALQALVLDSGEFEVPYSLKIIDGRELLLTVELGGMTKDQISKNVKGKCNQSSEGYEIELHGRKLEGDTLSGSVEVVLDKRKFGDFTLKIPPLEFGRFQFENYRKPIREDRDGQLTLRWALVLEINDTF
jgi:hypothetical protein